MNYISIRLSTLRGDQKIGFNTYIKVGDKMLLYLKKGDSFEGDRLFKLKEKKLRKMFILNDDEIQYREYLDKNIYMAYDNKSGSDIQTRADIVQGDQQANTEELFEDATNIAAYNLAKEAAGMYVDFILSNDEALNSIMNIKNLSTDMDQKIAHHGVAVATLAIALSHKLGMKGQKQLQLLALGSLLHDYGHYESTIDYTKIRTKMRPEELKFYLTHAHVGATKVSEKKHFDKTVCNIILQHEELSDGSGPEKLTEAETDPLALIVSTCNAFDRLVTFQNIPVKDALTVLLMQDMGTHPVQHIQYLAEILQNT